MRTISDEAFRLLIRSRTMRGRRGTRSVFLTGKRMFSVKEDVEIDKIEEDYLVSKGWDKKRLGL